MDMGRTRACTVACLLFSAGRSLTVAAADFDYELDAGIGKSDNITRSSVNEQDETIARAGTKFSFDRKGSRLDADLVGDLAYYDYLDGTYDSEVLGNFIGDARFGFVPDRFEWEISDNFGQVLGDPFSPATPDNRENINYFTTGPDLLFAFGSQNRMTLGARYANTTYEDSLFDSNGYSAEISFSHLLSSASSLGVHARAQEVDYDEDLLNGDYKQADAFARYAVDGARTHITMDLGYTQIDRDAATEKDDSVLARFSASRRVSAASTATLTAGHEFQSSGGAFAGAQAGGASSGLGATPGRQTVEPFINDYVTLGWQFARVRTNFSLNAALNKQTYNDAPALDETLTLFSTELTRTLSPRSTASLHAVYSAADFKQPDSDYGELNAGVSFRWRLSHSISLDLTYDYFDRNSDLATGDYNENRYWLSITYGNGTPRETPLAPAFEVDQVATP